MSNSFATKIGWDILFAQQQANPPALQILERFVAAIEPVNSIALKRELKNLSELVGSQVRAALVLFPDDFLTSIVVALGVAGQRDFMLQTIDWIIENEHFAWRYRPRAKNWQATIWSFVEDYIDSQRGEAAPDQVRASTMLDELTRFANVLTEVIKAAGTDPKAAMGPILAQEAAIKAMLEFIEPLFEAGVAETAAGQDPKIFKALVRQISGIEMIEMARKPTYDLFKVQWASNRALIVNAFPPDMGRTYPVLNFSQSDQSLPSAPTITPGEVLERRQSQIDKVLEFYGATLASPPNPNPGPSLRQKSFAATDKPASPLTHEGIVRLLAMVFLETYATTKVNPIEAGWEAALGLLKTLLDQLTMHPGHDLNDNGPNYLTTQFPLTLSGDQLHDCAVYAVRVGYWLHAMAARLFTKQGINLRLWSRLVTLPVHLALVVGIDPDEAMKDPDGTPSGGLVFVNNNHLDLLGGLDLAAHFAAWKANPGADKDKTKAGKGLTKEELRTKFFDDLAAGRFIPGVDMPVAGMDFLANATKVTTASVWSRYLAYRTWSRRHEIFGPAVFKGDGDYLEFYLKYLALLQSRAKFVNEVMIARLWNADGPDTYRTAMGKDEWEGPKAKMAMQRYVDAIDPVAQRYDDEITKFLDQPDQFLNEDAGFEMYRRQSQAKKRSDKPSHAEYLTLISEDFDVNGTIMVGPGARRAFSARNPDSSIDDQLGANLEDIKTHAKDCRLFLDGSWTKPEPPPKPPFVTDSRYRQVL